MLRLRCMCISITGVLSWNAGFKQRLWCRMNGRIDSFNNLGKKSRPFYDSSEPSSGLMTFEQLRSLAREPSVRSALPTLPKTWIHRRLKYPNLGQISAEDRYGKNLCYETFEEGWHVEEGSGKLIFFYTHYAEMLTIDTASPRPCRTGCAGRVGLSLGCPTFLFLPGFITSLPNNGISPWRRPHDHAHQVWHIFWGRDKVLHCPMCNGNWSCTSTWIHPSVSPLQIYMSELALTWVLLVILSQIISWCEVSFNSILASK